MKKKKYVVWSCGVKVKVDEDVFRVLMQDRWREEKRIERESRCRDEHGNRCTKCCQNCSKLRDGRPFSLERLIEDGFEPSDHNDVLEHVLRNELYDALYKEIQHLDSLNRQIMLLIAEGVSESDIASSV